MFTMCGPDNGSHFYNPIDPDGDPPACTGCGLVTDPEWVNTRFKVKRKGFDLSSTYDGQTIASDRFVAVARNVAGMRFLELPGSPGFHLVVVDPSVAFDAEARGTAFEVPCEVCKRFTQIAGATPAHLKPGQELPAGFSRTDQVFGSAGDKPDHLVIQGPLIIVDETTATLLKDQKLTGLNFRPTAS